MALGTTPTDTSLWKLNYDYGELDASGNVDQAKNTGNIAKQTISFAGLANPMVQTYKYDSLYRITEAKETAGSQTTWQQNYAYDRYGNRTDFAQNVGGQALAINSQSLPQVDSTTNRFISNQGYGYDKNGNIISDSTSVGGTRNFTFNGDNKQTEVRDPNIQTSPTNPDANVIGRYFYDGEGKRVKKVTATEITIFVYSSGKLVAEYSTQTPPANPTTNYVHTDTLQSVRAVSDAQGTVISRRDFMPFGEELYANSTNRTTDNKYSTNGQDNIRQRFTGYEKDTETNLDFAEARYYNNQHGRFTAVDPLMASGKSANPQTFNRYAYTSNNPISRIDKNGREWWDVINTNTNSRSIYWSTDRPTGGDGITVNRWTNYVYQASDNRWYALDPNSEQSEKFYTHDTAKYKYGLYANFNGDYDGILYELSGLKDFAYLAANMRTGNFNGSAYYFGKIAVTNGVGMGLGKFFAPAIQSFAGRMFSTLAEKTAERFPQLFSRVAAAGCFVAGTPVHTNKGLKAIEKIKAGDKVLSWNEKAKQFEYKTVINAFVKQAQQIVKVSVKGEKKVIEATPEHPFYVRTFHQARDNTSEDDGKADGEWKGAGELQIGDELLRPNGTWTKVIGVEIEARQEAVYNFTVEDNHDYFVGEKGTLVHNGNCAETAASVSDKLARYLLDPEHAVGGDKAAWFQQALGFTRENASDLAKQIVFDEGTAIQTGVTEFGIKYNQVIPITGENGKVIDVTFGWIRNNDGIVRLVTGIPTSR